MGDIDKAIEALEIGYEKTANQRLKDKLDELSPPEETTVTMAETTVTTVPTTVTTTETTTAIELVTVPDLAGMTQEEALSACEELGISCDIKTEKSDTVEKDHVISQSVAAGANVPVNYAISVTVSEGKKAETTTETVTTITQSTTSEYDYSHDTLIPFYIPSEITIFYNNEQKTKYTQSIDIFGNGDYHIHIADFDVDENNIKKINSKTIRINNPYLYYSTSNKLNRFKKFTYNDWDNSYIELPYEDGLTLGSGQYIFMINASDWNNVEKKINTELYSKINHYFDFNQKTVDVTGGAYGEIIGKLKYDDNGYLYEYEDYEYNEKSYYSYDNNNNIIKISTHTQYDSVETTQFIYENNKIVRINDGDYYVQYYKYDSNDNISSVECYAFDKLELKCVYEYDSIGNMTSFKAYNGDDELLESYEIKYKTIQVSEKNIKQIEEKYQIKFNR